MSNQMLRIKNSIRAPLFKVLNRRKEKFLCPVCDYHGPFVDKLPKKKIRSRLNAKCPSCSAMERHRFQWFILQKVLAGKEWSELSVLHFAPEPCLEDRLRAQCGRYVTADLLRTTVDYQFDVIDIPFALKQYQSLQSKFQVKTYKGGDHSFQHLEAAWPLIKTFIEQVD